MACERAAWSAQLSGDALMPAVADGMRVWDMWATADWSDALALSDKALRSVQREYDQGDPLALRLWGTLQLRAAVSAARAGNEQETEDASGTHGWPATERTHTSVRPCTTGTARSAAVAAPSAPGARSPAVRSERRAPRPRTRPVPS